jgi:hypothetical protein
MPMAPPTQTHWANGTTRVKRGWNEGGGRGRAHAEAAAIIPSLGMGKLLDAPKCQKAKENYRNDFSKPFRSFIKFTRLPLYNFPPIMTLINAFFTLFLFF